MLFLLYFSDLSHWQYTLLVFFTCTKLRLLQLAPRGQLSLAFVFMLDKFHLISFAIYLDSLVKHFLIQSLEYCCCSVAKLCPTPCDPMDCSLLGSSVHEISQARMLEWLAISFFRGSS